MFESSDSDRHARKLKRARQVTFDQPLALELGGEIPEVTVVYETYGQLGPERDNAVLVCHGSNPVGCLPGPVLHHLAPAMITTL